MRTTSTRAILALLFSSSVVLAASLTEDFSHFLSGKAPLDQVALDSMYTQFQTEYSTLASKHYSGSNRKAIFEDKVRDIISHNSNPNSTWFKSINEYSDMTDAEFSDYFNLRAEQNCSATNRPVASQNIESILRSTPLTWNWQDYGVVTPVKNQGKCGSCWTFSTVGSIEAHYMLKYGQFRNLSEQQLVDCAGDFDNHGCQGGLPSHAFEYIMYAGGLSEESSYPYTATNTSCNPNMINPAVGVNGGSVNISTSEVDMQVALFEHGPVSVAFQVIPGFRDYKTGVYANNTCKNGPDDVNHAVLAVGYGTENGVDYWMVKNSWGAAWGDNGFFKIQRGINMCGIAQCNSYPYQVVNLDLQGSNKKQEDQIVTE